MSTTDDAPTQAQAQLRTALQARGADQDFVSEMTENFNGRNFLDAEGGPDLARIDAYATRLVGPASASRDRDFGAGRRSGISGRRSRWQAKASTGEDEARRRYGNDEDDDEDRDARTTSPVREAALRRRPRSRARFRGGRT